MHYNSDNNYFFVNGKEIFKFKANCKNADFPTQFCRGSISNQFSAFNFREVSLKRIFSVDYNVIDKSDILNIHKYLILYIMLGFFFKLFLGLLNFRESLTNMDNVSSLAIYISLNNQLCMARPTLIDLNPDEYNQGLRCYPFMVNLDMCN